MISDYYYQVSVGALGVCVELAFLWLRPGGFQSLNYLTAQVKGADTQPLKKLTSLRQFYPAGISRVT